MTRLDAFRAKMPDNIDVALITDELNKRYLSGVDYTDGFLLITREDAYLFADSRYIEVAKRNLKTTTLDQNGGKWICVSMSKVRSRAETIIAFRLCGQYFLSV